MQTLFGILNTDGTIDLLEVEDRNFTNMKEGLANAPDILMLKHVPYGKRNQEAVKARLKAELEQAWSDQKNAPPEDNYIPDDPSREFQEGLL